jgi:hypothetical protein
MTGVPRSAAGGRVRTAHRIARLVLAAAAAATLWAAASGCGIDLGAGDDDGRADLERTLRLARHDFTAAADALVAGDRAAFLGWLPHDGGSPASVAAREGLAEVFDTLAPLPWRSFSFEVTPLDPAEGVFRVRGIGQLGDAGPPDRIAVVRHLKLLGAADGAVVLADATPESLRRRYLMALHDSLVLQRPGLIVLGDAAARGRAGAVMAAAARARPRLASLGLDTDPPVVITVYGSAADVRDALALGAATSRLVFFSHPSLRVAGDPWPTYDVGVTGPWLRDWGGSMDEVLRHELAHAYTVSWFGDDEKPPALLVEGIAQAAEGSPLTPALREEVATGDQLWPLPESFADADVWDGGDAEAVRLGYEIGGALVAYVTSRWGPRRLRPFVQAVAAAEPSEAGMDAALGGALGVSWREFFAGWRSYVLAGG